mgnify:CR=1 FL=1
MRPHLDWPSWQRSADYYPEGTLLWLDADTLIHERSGGHRSLEDFAHRFFAGPGGLPRPKPYDFDEVVATLQAVQPHGWAAWLRGHLDNHGPGAPLNGLLRGGWQLGSQGQLRLSGLSLQQLELTQAELRWTLEHVFEITPDQVARLKKIGVGVRVQDHDYIRNFNSSWNPGPPYRMLLESGIRMGAGSDSAVVGALNPNTAFLGSVIVGNGINAGILWLAFAYPTAFMLTLGIAVVVAVWLIARLWRLVTGMFRRHALRHERLDLVVLLAAVEFRDLEVERDQIGDALEAITPLAAV